MAEVSLEDLVGWQQQRKGRGKEWVKNGGGGVERQAEGLREKERPTRDDRVDPDEVQRAATQCILYFWLQGVGSSR